MFSLRDLRFVFCSLDLDVLRAQRIMGFFIVITHKSTRSESPITWYELWPRNARLPAVAYSSVKHWLI